MTVGIISKQTMVESIVKALETATPQEVAELALTLKDHPDGQEIMDGVAKELMGVLVQDIFGEILPGIGAVLALAEEEESVEEEVEETPLKDVIAAQVTAQQLSKQIREQINQPVEVKPLFVDYIQPGSVHTPAVDLSEVIKQQIKQQELNESVRARFAEYTETADTDPTKTNLQPNLADIIAQAISGAQEYTLEDVIQSILDEVAEEVIEQLTKNTPIKSFSISDDAIAAYEQLFFGGFAHKLIEKGLESEEGTEYKPEHTIYIMLKIAEYLSSKEGFELAFRFERGSVVPVMIKPKQAE
ncbi:hypothetical protein COJ01_17940 [Priestia megaterium]|uniref:hypothetical protein n=1 Tax=Priestia megaterium TaxID=1404 RepID=UPI000BF9A5E8|nr:hypothetical protein [Priestia megaterium]PFK99928.1 hypothetical protein COJ01_17940 [Priestia megaterium]